MSDHAPLLERAFTLDLAEDDYTIAEIEGEVPAYLRGTYYLNGPARFARGGQRYRHWLDGDGMVCRLGFTGNGVEFTNRFVRSAKWEAEEEAGKALFRTFGTAFEGDRLLRGIALASPVNVSVYPVGDTLLAFGEQGLPLELDPRTLATRGEYTFERKLNPISPFSAHPKLDYASGEMFNFGVSFSAASPMVNLYRFAAGGELVYRRRLPLEFPSSMHDFGLSSSHVVFYVAPYLLDMAALTGEGRTLMDCLSWEPERGSRLLVAARDSGEEVASIPIGSSYCLHLANCFETGDGLLTIDLVELDEPVYDQYDVPELFRDVRFAHPKRYVVDVERGAVVETVGFDYDLMCDFPAIDPRRVAQKCDDFWSLGISATAKPGRKFLDQVVHVDWRSGKPGIYQAPPRHYLGGEPIFLPDPRHERRGSVICQVFDAEREAMAFLLFDAFDVARGPVATLRLKRPVHLGFHASFHPAEPW